MFLLSLHCIYTLNQKIKQKMKELKIGFLALIVAFFMVACSSTPGEKVEAQEEQEVQDVAPTAVELTVDTEGSVINWVGTKPTGQHSGVMKIKEGKLQLEEDKLVGGKFTLDMVSIEVTDLEGEKKSDLEGHLKTGDFFEVEKFPTATFEITNVEAVEGNPDATHNITGNLTMRDQTKSVTLPAKVEFNEGVLSAKTPDFKIDRTEWGIVYKSSKVGDMAINDEMGIQINLMAK
jgi:polyisoprenoid-binding protein YceI